MKQMEYIAAMDLGTSKMIAMAAQKNDQGILSILAAASTESEKCIRRGCVYNIDGTVEKTTALIKNINEELEQDIEKIYVGIGGQSICSKTHSIKQDVTEGSVKQERLDLLYQECKIYKHESLDVLAIVSPEYYLDGRLETNPVGVICNSIEARYQIILGKPALKANIQQCLKKANIQTADFFITPLATAEAVLGENEKNLGCALIEFGAGVTYLSIYKGGALQYLRTIPLGSDVITKDIMSMDVLEDEAELLKIKGDLPNKEIDPAKLELIIDARIEEIIDNVIGQINESGHAGHLPAGIILTGGGSQLGGLDTILKDKTELNVRIAGTKKTLINVMSDFAGDLGNTAVIGMLSLGTENCAKEEVVPEPTIEGGLFGESEAIQTPKPKEPKKVIPKGERKPQPPKGESRIRKGMKSIFDTFFGDEEDNNNEE